ncbi:lantibiotic immunity ABC transporter MutG family permease subunit [Paenibacillus monticola]|uniref:Lantibiotic immunity ABC transporter MutG family permease subunit n=1 Tax=Paenibacillus monticola TaxID=2666075 RepID=A0A7X2H413_9BACL|nr:lantibiotic immunity ABC transporter MutG family permease subunit [Paenibacillus monticola]MRN53174.1 lantibiotic immunity ABC transporter MutG family permease subunit [Paenibacillus monticola]
MSLFRALSSDWLKTKYTSIRLIVVTVPILYPLFMLWYFTKQSSQSQIYDAFFMVISVAMPIIAGLLCGLTGMQEESAGNFNAILGSTLTRTVSYISKFTLLILMTAISIFFSTLVLLAGMKWFLNVEKIQVGGFLQGAMFVLLGSLILFALHLYLSFAFGIGASVASGGAGFLIAAIFGGTIVGDHIWQYVPWTWAARLSQLPEVFIRDFQAPSGMNLPAFFREQLSMGMSAVITGTIFVLIGSIIWFNRWEGRK